MKAGGQKASWAGGYDEEERIRGAMEGGNENLNQGNILLAWRTEVEEERAEDEKVGGGRGDMKGGKEEGERKRNRLVGEEGWRKRKRQHRGGEIRDEKA